MKTIPYIPHFLTLLFLFSFLFACDGKWRMEEEEFFADLYEEEASYDGSPLIPKEAGISQEELIKEHKVKVCREDYDDGSYSISYYNTDGMLEKSEYLYREKLSITKYVYEFDDQGNTTKREGTEDGETTSYSWTYDEHGRELTYTFIYKDGDESHTTYSYDDEKRTKTEEDEYGSYVYYYNADGFIEKMESYDDKGGLESTVNMILDENGSKTREESEIMGMKVIDEMTYNERGQLLRKDRGGMVSVSMVYEYDEKGLTTKFERIGGTLPSVSTYSYEYY